MKLHEWYKLHNLKTDREKELFFQLHGIGIYSCPFCDEILWFPDPTFNKCPDCGYDGTLEDYERRRKKKKEEKR